MAKVGNTLTASAKRSKREKPETKFQKLEVAMVFERYPESVRKQLLRVRELIFDVAASTMGVGPLEEVLRWGEPSYLTTESGVGSIVRINKLPKRDDALAVYFHCQTNLIATFRSLYSRKLKFAIAPSCSMLATSCRYRSSVAASPWPSRTFRGGVR